MNNETLPSILHTKFFPYADYTTESRQVFIDRGGPETYLSYFPDTGHLNLQGHRMRDVLSLFKSLLRDEEFLPALIKQPVTTDLAISMSWPQFHARHNNPDPVTHRPRTTNLIPFQTVRIGYSKDNLIQFMNYLMLPHIDEARRHKAVQESDLGLEQVPSPNRLDRIDHFVDRLTLEAVSSFFNYGQQLTRSSGQPEGMLPDWMSPVSGAGTNLLDLFFDKASLPPKRDLNHRAVGLINWLKEKLRRNEYS